MLLNKSFLYVFMLLSFLEKVTKEIQARMIFQHIRAHASYVKGYAAQRRKILLYD